MERRHILWDFCFMFEMDQNICLEHWFSDIDIYCDWIHVGMLRFSIKCENIGSGCKKHL